MGPRRRRVAITGVDVALTRSALVPARVLGFRAVPVLVEVDALRDDERRRHLEPSVLACVLCVIVEGALVTHDLGDVVSIRDVAPVRAGDVRVHAGGALDAGPQDGWS